MHVAGQPPEALPAVEGERLAGEGGRVHQESQGTQHVCRLDPAAPFFARQVSVVLENSGRIEPDRIDVAFNGVEVCRDGAIGEDRSLVDLSGRDVRVAINLRNGRGRATVWTNDLTYDYVKENAEYST